MPNKVLALQIFKLFAISGMDVIETQKYQDSRATYFDDVWIKLYEVCEIC